MYICTHRDLCPQVSTHGYWSMNGSGTFRTQARQRAQTSSPIKFDSMEPVSQRSGTEQVWNEVWSGPGRKCSY